MEPEAKAIFTEKLIVLATEYLTAKERYESAALARIQEINGRDLERFWAMHRDFRSLVLCSLENDGAAGRGVGEFVRRGVCRENGYGLRDVVSFHSCFEHVRRDVTEALSRHHGLGPETAQGLADCLLLSDEALVQRACSGRFSSFEDLRKSLDASLGASVVAGLRRARERLCALLGQSLVHFMAYEGRRLGLLSDEESAPAPG